MLVTGTPLTSWWVTVVAPPDPPADETAKVDSFPLSGGTGGARDEDEGGKGCMAKAGPPENSKQSIRFRYVNFAFAAGNNLFRIKGKGSIYTVQESAAQSHTFFKPLLLRKMLDLFQHFLHCLRTRHRKQAMLHYFMRRRGKTNSFSW